MKFDSKVKGGLAWTGLFVILAVPAANLLFGAGESSSANVVAASTAKPAAAVKPAAPTLQLPAKPAGEVAVAAAGADPVDTFIKSGKKLPAYISDGDAAPAAVKPVVPSAAATPAAAAKPAAVTKPVEVAAVAPVAETPPVPRPRDARPKLTVASTPATIKAPIVDEKGLISSGAVVTKPKAPVEPFPLSDKDTAARKDNIVRGDQLEEWDSGSLAEYLRRKGLLNDAPQAPVDDSEFVFNEGPSRPDDNFFLF